jgi:hypothetical protein
MDSSRPDAASPAGEEAQRFVLSETLEASAMQRAESTPPLSAADHEAFLPPP